ncbi:hypothetical protein [Terrabacter sp. NPDC080008]|uniref:WXG100 family type VII secretion target n=1 Tax=Terrabacter sp. NPDC080008 TaxID=3155176 RepID=UPI00344C40D0
MAIYKKGADPVALRASAERLSGHARECDGVKVEAGRAVQALRGQWGGSDLDQLMERWPPVEAQLSQFGSELGRLAEALRRNAGQQETASGPGLSGGAGAPGAPLGGGTGGAGAGAPGSNEGDSGPSVLDGLGVGMTVAGLPSLLAHSAGVLSTFSRADGWRLSGKYLGEITELAKAGDPLFEALPSASKFAATSNMVAEAWDMKGLSGLFSEGSAAGKVVGKFGVLGPVGIGLSAASFVDSVRTGNTEGMVTNGLGTALMAGAVFAPPPADVVCGVASLGVAAYQNIPAVHDAVNAVGHEVADVASDIGHAASDTWHSVTSWF